MRFSDLSLVRLIDHAYRRNYFSRNFSFAVGRGWVEIFIDPLRNRRFGRRLDYVLYLPAGGRRIGNILRSDVGYNSFGLMRGGVKNGRQRHDFDWLKNLFVKKILARP